MSISRRDVLKSLAMGAAATSVLRTIPAQAAEYAHRMVAAEKAAAKVYAPKFFPAHQYKTLQASLPDHHSRRFRFRRRDRGRRPGVHRSLTSENTEYQVKLGGGLMWLDGTCSDRYGKLYLDCAPQQQKEILDQIAYRNNAVTDPSLSQGVEFFSFLRNMTADGFFTSEIGIKYLGYIGSTFLKEFPGCPPVPGI